VGLAPFRAGSPVVYLLDTDICSAHIRRPGGLAYRFIQHIGRLWMPSIDSGPWARLFTKRARSCSSCGVSAVAS
jgi:hypothetical protein